MLSRIDHLVYATPDLEAGIDRAQELLGVRATRGGTHPGWGTRNALISLGKATYLEVIGPDNEQPEAAGQRVFAVDQLAEPRLVTWAAKSKDLRGLAVRARQQGIALGEVFMGSRELPDGGTVRWELTDPYRVGLGGLRPIFIDWGSSPHPATTAAPGCALAGLSATHPDPPRVSAELSALGLELPVGQAGDVELTATIRCPHGEVVLR